MKGRRSSRSGSPKFTSRSPVPSRLIRRGSSLSGSPDGRSQDPGDERGYRQSRRDDSKDYDRRDGDKGSGGKNRQERGRDPRRGGHFHDHHRSRDHHGKHRGPDHPRHGHGRESPVEDRWHRRRIGHGPASGSSPPRGREGSPRLAGNLEALKDAPPPVGTIVQAEVQSVRPFGIFVRMKGFSQDGLVHSSQVSADIAFTREDEDEMKVKAMEFIARTGETVWVKVVEVREDPGGRFRIGCSMKAVSQEDGSDLDPSGRMAAGNRGGLKDGAPDLHSIHQATVKSVRPFGIFVQLDGWRRYGLVPSHQVSDHMGISRDDSDEEKVAALQGVVSVDERLWVKVVEVGSDERGVRISCSMKLVSQADGHDLDPNNLQYRPRGEGGGPGGRAPMGQHAGEVRNSKIDWGHLAAGEYQHGDQTKRYEILEDEDEGNGVPRGRPEGLPSLPSPRGRGRGMTVPAWMSNPEAQAPPAAALGAPPGGTKQGGAITSVEEALAILEKFRKKSSKSKKGKKESDRKKRKRSKEHKEHKSSKKSKKSRRRSQSSSGSGSESD